MDAKDRLIHADALSADANLLLTQNTRHCPRDWKPRRGIDSIDAGTLLRRLAADCPYTLREAHRFGVDSRPQSEEEVFALLEQSTGKAATLSVRAVVTTEAQAESKSETAD